MHDPFLSERTLNGAVAPPKRRAILPRARGWEPELSASDMAGGAGVYDVRGILEDGARSAGKVITTDASSREYRATVWSRSHDWDHVNVSK